MKRLTIAIALALAAAAPAGCAGNKALVAAQGSHDVLALAQDTEAQLCWGVADAKAAVPDRSVCTSAVAKQIGLTDARHRDINSKLEQAFLLHEDLAKLARTGASADYSNLNALLDSIIAIVRQLQQTPTVLQLASNVAAAKK